MTARVAPNANENGTTGGPVEPGEGRATHRWKERANGSGRSVKERQWRRVMLERRLEFDRSSRGHSCIAMRRSHQYQQQCRKKKRQRYSLD